MPRISQKSTKVRVAIIGTGGMANHHAREFSAIKDSQMYAALDVDRKRAEDYAAKYGIKHVYTDLSELLANPNIDAVSIVTPDASHAPISIEALKAGKHVLCEKPLALNHADAKRMVAAAKKAGTINMVNFSYRNWAPIQAVKALVDRGVLGELRHVEASYLQAWLVSKIWGDWRTTPAWLWRLSTKHGSRGVLGDIGVHIVDFATYPAGPISSVHCKLKTFRKAKGDRIGEYPLDANDSAVMTVTYANGAIGTIQTSRFVGGHTNRVFLKISGTKGTIEIDSEKTTTGYRICVGKDLDTCTWRDVVLKPTATNHQRFIKAIRSGKQEQPDFSRGAEVQKILDACIASDAKAAPVSLR